MAQDEKARNPPSPSRPRPASRRTRSRWRCTPASATSSLGRRQLGAVRADGQAPAAVRGATQGHRPGEVHLRRQAAGNAPRPDDRSRGRRRRDPLDRHLEGRGPARRQGGLDGRLASRPLRRAGRGRGGRRLADVARDAARLVKSRTRRSPSPTSFAPPEGGRPARVRPRQEPAGPNVARKGNVAGPPAAAGAAAETSRRASPRPSRARGNVLLPRPHPLPARDPRRGGVLEGDQLTVYASTQGIFAVREGLAEALGIDRKNVRVLCEHMGGGFGSKLGPSASGSAFAMVACRLARKPGRRSS